MFLLELSLILSISIILVLNIELNWLSVLRVKMRLSAMKNVNPEYTSSCSIRSDIVFVRISLYRETIHIMWF